MKRFSILSIIFLLFLLAFPLESHSQKRKLITLEFKNVPLPTALKKIEKASGYKFLFVYEEISRFSVSCKIQDKSINEAMQLVIGDKPLEYAFQGNEYINVSVKKSSRRSAPRSEQQNRKSMTVVRGKVYDSNNNPLPGVSITNRDSNLRTISKADGSYQIAVTSGEKSMLLYSFIGMKTESKTITSNGGEVELNIIMKENASELQEVVVTGIFKKPMAAFTGSASVVSSKEIKQYEGRNLISTLANIDPSFNIITNNDAGFNPNNLPELQVRGTSSLVGIQDLQTGSQQITLNTPLILLDGFEITLQRMMDLDVNEVESVTLLKDGSATAIYGSQGANGIIVITTKEPEKGKLKFSYNGDMNIEVPDLSDYHLLKSRDKLELERLSGFYNSTDPGISLQLMQMYSRNLAAVERGVDTYWLSKPLRTGIGQRHNMKIEGGDNAFRYAVIANYNDQAGVMKQSGRQTFNGSINLSYKHKSLIFRNLLTIGNMKASESPYGSFADYVKLNPYWRPYDDNGQIVKFFDTNDLYWGGAKNYPRNPLYDATLPLINNKNYTSIINTFSIEWHPSTYFTVRANAGMNFQWDESNNFKPRSHTSFESYTGQDVMRKGKYVYGTGRSSSYTLRVTTSYARTFNKLHNVYLGFSADMDEKKSHGYGFTVEGFTQENPKSLIMGLQYQKDSKPSGYETITRRVGLVFNLNYSYDNRYFTDLSYRVDGSSQFGKNKRFAPFYSIGFGWNIHNEKFIKPIENISRLTLRTSFGQNGSQQFQSFQAIATYDYYTSDRYFEWMGIYQKALENTNLEWQKTNKYNIGLDADLFKNRIGMTLDIYKENTSNMLSDRALPWSNGFSSYTENIGEVENKGFELRLRANIIRDFKKNLFLNMTASIASNDSKMKRLSDALKREYNKIQKNTKKDPSKIIREGESLNTIYAVKSLGIDPSNGREVFLKKDGSVTYTWNSEDLVASGNSRPKYRGSLNSSLRYKNFGLSLAFAYYWGGQVYNNTLLNKIENADKKYNVDERVYNDRWKQVGDYSFFKGINNTSPTYATSRFVQNENVFTCKNIQLTYELHDNKFLKKYAGLESLILKGDISDLFYWSTVKQERGISYPFSRRFSVGLSLSF